MLSVCPVCRCIAPRVDQPEATPHPVASLVYRVQRPLPSPDKTIQSAISNQAAFSRCPTGAWRRFGIPDNFSSACPPRAGEGLQRGGGPPPQPLSFRDRGRWRHLQEIQAIDAKLDAVLLQDKAKAAEVDAARIDLMAKLLQEMQETQQTPVPHQNDEHLTFGRGPNG